MKCYRLKDGGYGYKGHVMNFEQDPGHIFKVLPLHFDELPIVILRKRDEKHPNNYKDLKVRREAIRSWLLFLQRYNTAYNDIRIYDNRLNALPDDDCIANEIKTQIEEDKSLQVETETLPNEITDVKDLAIGLHDDSDVEDYEEDMNQGPEQGGATGDCDQKDAPPVIEEFLFTSPDEPHGNESLPSDEVIIKELLENASKKARANDHNIIEMPEAGRKLNDYSEPFIRSMAFPYGLEDVTGQDRKVIVSMTDSNAHLLRYCIRDRTERKEEYTYPFANHPSWMHWAQNTVERHRHQTQKSVCLKNNPGDQNITEEELREIISEGGSDFERLIGRMQTYNANIAGSNAYFNKKKREVHA